MVDRGGGLRLVASADLTELARLAGEVAAHLEAGKVAADDRFRASLGLEELFSNVVKHAAARTVEVTLRIEPDDVVLMIVDDGLPFDPASHKLSDDPVTADEVKPGHMGLKLLRRVVGPLRYERREGRNVVEVRVQRAASA